MLLTLCPSWQDDPKSTILMADLLGLQRRMFSGFRSQWMIDSSGVAKNNNAVSNNKKIGFDHLLHFPSFFFCRFIPGCNFFLFFFSLVHHTLIKSGVANKQLCPHQVQTSEPTCTQLLCKLPGEVEGDAPEVGVPQ